MPTVDENAAAWGDLYDWSAHGEEWSVPWGGSEAQWHATLLPRLRRFLPAGTILEVGPGYGRWTSFLREHCDRLVVVDLSEGCIQACRERFRGDERIRFHVNDGRSLGMVADDSVDFVFSFDSLVHAEADVIADYLGEFARTLRPTGSGLVHHSNAGAYGAYFGIRRRLPGRVDAALRKARLLETDGWRATSMTAAAFRRSCDEAGLHCTTQEIVNWRSRRLVDCISTFTRAPVAAGQAPRIVENRRFMDEAAAAKRLASLYGAPS